MSGENVGGGGGEGGVDEASQTSLTFEARQKSRVSQSTFLGLHRSITFLAKYTKSKGSCIVPHTRTHTHTK